MERKLRLRQWVITSILSLLFFSLSAQSDKKFFFKNKEYIVEQSVSEFLGKDKLEEYSLKAPLKLMYFNFYIKNSFLVLNELPSKKNNTVLTISYLPGITAPTETSGFEILKTTIQPSDKNLYYRFNNQYIMVYPQATINKNFDEYIRSLNN